MTKNLIIKNSIKLICFIFLSLAVFFIIFVSQIQGQTNSLRNSYASNSDVNIVIIQHDSCPWSYFWCVVENGINDAAKDLNVNVEILRPIRILKENNDKVIEEHKRFLKEVSERDDKTLDAVGITLIHEEKEDQDIILYLNELMMKNIPINVYNSDLQVVKKLNNKLRKKLAYIGQDDYQAGYQAGKALLEKIKGKEARAVCINDLPEAINLQNRCNGFFKAIKDQRPDIESKNLDSEYNELKFNCKNINGQNENYEECRDIIYSSIKKDYDNNNNQNQNQNFKTIYLSLGPKGVKPFSKFINDNNIDKEKFAHGIFDLSEEIIDNIQNGNTLFAIDQQPYLQGYMIVQSLFWKVKYKLEIQNKIEDTKIISTGSILIKKEDENKLKQIKELLGKYR